MKHNIDLVPWDVPFLPALLDLCKNITQPEGLGLDSLVLVFPHSRPRRYFMELLRQDNTLQKPLLLPRFFTLPELMTQCSQVLSQRGLMSFSTGGQAALLDQVGLLKQVVEALPTNEGDGESQNKLLMGLRQGKMDMARFFPWGIRLAQALEECFQQGISPRDLQHVEGEVDAFAADLLASFNSIYHAYVALLDEKQLGTPGLDSMRLSEAVYILQDESDQSIQDIFPFLRGKKLIFAGFVRPSQCEERLLAYFWNQGARLCWHSHPSLAPSDQNPAQLAGQATGLHACQDHAQWLRLWGCQATLLCPPTNHTPHFHFFAAYDAHSQLAQLQKDVKQVLEQKSARALSAAIALPNSALLMPVLHNMPNQDINISMGYPLSRSLLARLLELVLKIQESKHEGIYHWRGLLDLVRHPYTRMLRVEEAKPEDVNLQEAETSEQEKPDEALRPLLHALERLLRQGSRLVDLPLVLDKLLDDEEMHFNLAQEALLMRVLDVFVLQWDSVHSLKDMGEMLGRICDVLLQYGSHIWPRFPLDAECLFRLVRDVLPSLSTCTLAEEFFPQDTLFTIFRQSMADARVPFEADPLTGLQVLGMLETRLLHFDSIFIPEATEDFLPGAPQHDPLLPDNLRALLGLPHSHSRESLAAHTFYRFCASAKHVYLYWQEGVDSSALLDSKKQRSRFVEAALWQEEQRQKRLLKPGMAPLRQAFCHIAPPGNIQAKGLLRSPAADKAMQSLMLKGLSASTLDSYAQCPLRFYYEKLCRLKGIDEVNEGDDHQGLGVLLHTVLAEAYAPFEGKDVDKALLENSLPALFLKHLAASDMAQSLPAESFLMLQSAGPMRLKRYLYNQPPTHIYLLEKDMRRHLVVDSTSFTLKGRLDRVDRRGQGLIVLDYKSGSCPSISPKFWQDTGLWALLENWQPTPADKTSPDPLPRLAASLPSIQLPLYLFLLQQESQDLNVENAAWVELALHGEEKALWDTIPEQAQHIMDETIPSLLRFLLRHMAHCLTFLPHEGKHCGWCAMRALCQS